MKKAFVLSVWLSVFLFIVGCKGKIDEKYTRVSFKYLQSKFGKESRLSQEEKEKWWKGFKNYFVKWGGCEVVGTCEKSKVHGYNMIVRVLPFTDKAKINFPTDNPIVKTADGKEVKLTEFIGGEEVKISGRLTSYGTIYAYTLEEGEIIEVIKKETQK